MALSLPSSAAKRQGAISVLPLVSDGGELVDAAVMFGKQVSEFFGRPFSALSKAAQKKIGTGSVAVAEGSEVGELTLALPRPRQQGWRGGKKHCPPRNPAGISGSSGGPSPGDAPT